MNVLVFRTTTGGTACLQVARKALYPFREVIRWTVDLDDCDRVLRIAPAYPARQSIASTAVINALNPAGFMCEELLYARVSRNAAPAVRQHPALQKRTGAEVVRRRFISHFLKTTFSTEDRSGRGSSP